MKIDFDIHIYIVMVITFLAVSMQGGWIDGYETDEYQVGRSALGIDDSLIVLIGDQDNAVSLWFVDEDGSVVRYRFYETQLSIRGAMVNDTLLLLYGSMYDIPAIQTFSLSGDTLYAMVWDDFPGEGEFRHFYLDDEGRMVGVANSSAGAHLLAGDSWVHLSDSRIFSGVDNFVAGVGDVWRVGVEGIEAHWVYEPAMIMAMALHQGQLVMGFHGYDDGISLYMAVDTVDGAEVWTRDLDSSLRIQGIKSCDSTLAICWNSYGIDIDSTVVAVTNRQGEILTSYPAYRPEVHIYAQGITSLNGEYYVFFSMEGTFGLGHVDSDSFYYRRTHYVPEEVVDESTPLPMGNTIKAYPSPFNSSISIDLPENASQVKIVDISGRVVFDCDALDERNQISWRPQGYIESGIYIVNAISDVETMTQRIVYIK